MSYANKNLVKGVDNIPVPQYFDAGSDSFNPVLGEDGATFVKIKPEVADITVINASAVAGVGEYTGALAKSKSITLEFYGAGAATSTFSFYLVGPSGVKRVAAGIRKTVSIEQVTTAVVGDIVSFGVPAGYKLRIENTLPVGGAVTAKGTAE